MKPTCEICGKPNMDKEEDYCFGCGHIVCSDCCYDLEYADIIAGGHNIRSHLRAFLFKVKWESWLSWDFLLEDAEE